MSVEKYGRPGAGAEDHDAALLHVPLGAARDVRLGDLGHRDRRLHAGGGAGLLEEVLQGERVHDGAEHAHVVGAAAVHAALAELGAAEEVAAADDDGDLDAVDRRGDLARDLADDIGVDPQLAAAERLARELQKDSPASGRLIDHVSSSRRVQTIRASGCLRA